MFGKIFTAFSLVLALSVQVYGHAAVAPALGVNGGTPDRGDVKNPNNNNPCGNGVNIATAIDSSQAVSIKDGSITVSSINFNGGGDGSRQVSAKLDVTGKGDAFNADLTVTKNGDPSPNQEEGNDDVVVTIPADTKCTGGKDGNKCLVQFKTTAGFGNCVVVQQEATAAQPVAGNANATNGAADAAGNANANNGTPPAAGNANANNGAADAAGNANANNGAADTAENAGTGAAADKSTPSAAGAGEAAAGNVNATATADTQVVANNNTGAVAAADDSTPPAAGAGAAAAGNVNAAATADTQVAADNNTVAAANDSTPSAAGAANAGANVNANNNNGNGKKKSKKNKNKKKKGSRPAGTRAARAVLAGIDIKNYEAPEVLRRSWSWTKDVN